MQVDYFIQKKIFFFFFNWPSTTCITNNYCTFVVVMPLLHGHHFHWMKTTGMISIKYLCISIQKSMIYIEQQTFMNYLLLDVQEMKKKCMPNEFIFSFLFIKFTFFTSTNLYVCIIAMMKHQRKLCWMTCVFVVIRKP